MEAILNASQPNAFDINMFEQLETVERKVKVIDANDTYWVDKYLSDDTDESKPNLYDVQDSAGVDKYLADIANQKNIS